jgi:hypothetical protein
LDVIKVKGKTKAVKVYEVYGDKLDKLRSEDEFYYDTYQKAFNAYLSQDFTLARDKFEEALSLRPDDPAAKEMIARIDTIDPDKLPADWDGSITLTSK